LGDKTSKREDALAKPLKPSKEFSISKGGAQSSGLSFTEKTSSTKVVPRPLAIAKTGGRKASLASTAGDDVGYASARVVNLYPSSSSEEEVSPLEHHRKRARQSPSPKATHRSFEYLFSYFWELVILIRDRCMCCGQDGACLS
jgi:hypothetical protein